ncbi:hypothetical protein CDD83_3707 [Cordyceps sp. RAO-2017]|nr:hypothetical protein CDD83_3707 [Cordyceps sp. RAO-2017]
MIRYLAAHHLAPPPTPPHGGAALAPGTPCLRDLPTSLCISTSHDGAAGRAALTLTARDGGGGDDNDDDIDVDIEGQRRPVRGGAEQNLGVAGHSERPLYPSLQERRQSRALERHGGVGRAEFFLHHHILSVVVLLQPETPALREKVQEGEGQKSESGNETGRGASRESNDGAALERQKERGQGTTLASFVMLD